MLDNDPRQNLNVVFPSLSIRAQIYEPTNVNGYVYQFGVQ